MEFQESEGNQALSLLLGQTLAEFSQKPLESDEEEEESVKRRRSRWEIDEGERQPAVLPTLERKPSVLGAISLVCPLCSKVFPSTAILEMHAAACNPEEDKRCPLCQQTFAVQEDLEEHAETCQGMIEETKCPLCQKAFDDLASLQDHARVCNPKQQEKDDLALAMWLASHNSEEEDEPVLIAKKMSPKKRKSPPKRKAPKQKQKKAPASGLPGIDMDTEPPFELGMAQDWEKEEEIRRYSLYPRRNVDPTTVACASDAHFRLCESQLHRTLGGRHLEVTKVVYVLNPRLVSSFLRRMVEFDTTLGHDTYRTILAFHGTAEKNVGSIVRENYDMSRVGSSTGSMYGAGIYFSESSNTSLSYIKASGGRKKENCVILNLILCGREFKTNRARPGGSLESGHHCHIVPKGMSGGGAEIVVVFDVCQILPCYVIYFK